MINSVSQSPTFGKSVFLYVKGDAAKAEKAVKNAFNGYIVKKPAVNSMFKDVNKFELECENWSKTERDILWDKLIGRRVAEEVVDGKKTKKVIYDGLPTFVSMG